MPCSFSDWFMVSNGCWPKLVPRHYGQTILESSSPNHHCQIQAGAQCFGSTPPHATADQMQSCPWIARRSSMNAYGICMLYIYIYMYSWVCLCVCLRMFIYSFLLTCHMSSILIPSKNGSIQASATWPTNTRRSRRWRPPEVSLHNWQHRGRGYGPSPLCCCHRLLCTLAALEASEGWWDDLCMMTWWWLVHIPHFPSFIILSMQSDTLMFSIGSSGIKVTQLGPWKRITVPTL